MRPAMRCVCAWTVVLLVSARRYERCELARDFLRNGLPSEQLATWVCIAYHESRFDTAAVNRYSKDYGILQISELFWCGPTGANACGVPCSHFVDDDIADDVRCALRIHREHTELQGDGFLAWVGYISCRDKHVKKYLADCGDLHKNVTLSHAKISPHLAYIVNQTYFRDIDNLKPPVFPQQITTSYKDNRKLKMQTIGRNDSVLNKIFNIDELRLPIFNISSNTLSPTSSKTVRIPNASMYVPIFSTRQAPVVSTAIPNVDRHTATFPITAASTVVKSFEEESDTTLKFHVPSIPTKAPTLSSKTKDVVYTYAGIKEKVNISSSPINNPKVATTPTASSTTQRPRSSTSIFDLYLRSTRPKPVTYSFLPFTGKWNHVQIFYGGSTTPHTHLLGKYVDLDLLKQYSHSEDDSRRNRYMDSRETS